MAQKWTRKDHYESEWTKNSELTKNGPELTRMDQYCVLLLLRVDLKTLHLLCLFHFCWIIKVKMVLTNKFERKSYYIEKWQKCYFLFPVMLKSICPTCEDRDSALMLWLLLNYEHQHTLFLVVVLPGLTVVCHHTLRLVLLTCTHTHSFWWFLQFRSTFSGLDSVFVCVDLPSFL